MPAYTPFLTLYKPGGGSTGLIVPDEVVDIDRLNANSDLIDAFAAGWGHAAERNHNLYGPAASLSAVTGMKLGDTYQESDGDKKRWMRSAAGTWKLWDAPVVPFTSFGTSWTTATAATGTLRAFVRSGVTYVQGSLRSAATGTPSDSIVATLPDLSYAPKYGTGAVQSSAATSGTGSTMIISFGVGLTGVFGVAARSHATPNSVDFPLNMHWLIDLD